MHYRQHVFLLVLFLFFNSYAQRYPGLEFDMDFDGEALTEGGTVYDQNGLRISFSIVASSDKWGQSSDCCEMRDDYPKGELRSWESTPFHYYRIKVLIENTNSDKRIVFKHIPTISILLENVDGPYVNICNNTTGSDERINLQLSSIHPGEWILMNDVSDGGWFFHKPAITRLVISHYVLESVAVAQNPRKTTPLTNANSADPSVSIDCEGEEEKEQLDDFISDLEGSFDSNSDTDQTNISEVSDYILNESTRNVDDSGNDNLSYDKSGCTKLKELLTQMRGNLTDLSQNGLSNGTIQGDDLKPLNKNIQQFNELYNDLKIKGLLSPTCENEVTDSYKNFQQSMLEAANVKVQPIAPSNTGYSYRDVQKVNCDQKVNSLRSASFSYESKRRQAIDYEQWRCRCINGEILKTANSRDPYTHVRNLRKAYYQNKDPKDPDVSPLPNKCIWRQEKWNQSDY